MAERVTEFFAVTKTSLYRVRAERSEPNGVPLVQKISQRADSAIAVGGRLLGGTHVAITRRGLFLYCQAYSHRSWSDERPQRLEQVDSWLWGDHTSPIIGLFLDKHEANACFAASRRQCCDRRWREATSATLATIGDDHPVFIISRSPVLAVIC